MKALKIIQIQLYSFFYPGTRWGWGVNVTPRPLYPEKDSWYLSYRRWYGHQGLSGRVRETSPPPGFKPQTVQLK